MDRHPTRVVFQDIDGCLNPPSGPLPDGPGQSPSAEQAQLLGEIGRAMDDSAVAEVVLNTGRSLNAVDFVLDALGSSKLRYTLAEHGAVAFDSKKRSGIDLREIAMRCGPADRAQRYAELQPIREAISWYNEEGETQLSALFGIPLPALPKSANLTLMVPAGARPKHLVAALEEILNTQGEIDSSGFVYHASDLYVDVISKVSKGDGALLLLEELGASPAEAIAMGDGENDISMFEVFAGSFCPANAASKLKRVCRSRAGVVSSLHCGEAALEFYRSLA